MARKINNNLILVSYINGDKQYYTSMSKAGLKLALAVPSVKWAIDHGNVLTDVEGKKFTIGIVDGSEVPYKLINNI